MTTTERKTRRNHPARRVHRDPAQAPPRPGSRRSRRDRGHRRRPHRADRRRDRGHGHRGPEPRAFPRPSRCHSTPVTRTRGKASTAGSTSSLSNDRRHSTRHSCGGPRQQFRGARLGPGARLRCQAAEPTAVREIGLMWAKALRAFHVGKARTSPEGPWSWMRRSRIASAQVSCPACHLTKASDSAVM